MSTVRRRTMGMISSVDGTLVFVLSMILFSSACGGGATDKAGSEDTSGGEATSADSEEVEDEWSGQGGEAPADEETGESVSDSPWGAPDAETGEPLPKRKPLTGSAAQTFSQGVSAARVGRNDEARQAFERTLSLEPKSFRALYNLGVLEERQGNLNRALEYFERALQIQPDFERAADGAAKVYLQRGQKSDAVSLVERLAKKWVRNLAMHAVYSEVLTEAGRLDAAVDAARVALRRDERYVPAMVAIAKASLKQGRKELATAVIEQALAIDKDNADLHFMRGRMLLEEIGRLRDALGELKRAVAIRPDHVEARVLLGTQLLEGANYKDALEHLQVGARLAPKEAVAHLNLGEAYRSNEKWAPALRSYDRARELDPKLPGVHFNLGLLYMVALDKVSGMSKLEALQRAVAEFKEYRDLKGPRIARNDPSAGYLEALNRQIGREKTRIEREKKRKARDAKRAAEAAQKEEGVNPDDGESTGLGEEGQ